MSIQSQDQVFQLFTSNGDFSLRDNDSRGHKKTKQRNILGSTGNIRSGMNLL
jgi:hypothetical protein